MAIDLDRIRKRWAAVEPGTMQQVGIHPDYLADVQDLIAEVALLRVMLSRERRGRFDAEAMTGHIAAATASTLRHATDVTFDAEDRIAAALASVAEHRAILVGRGRYPERAEECSCEGCNMYRALITSPE